MMNPDRLVEVLIGGQPVSTANPLPTSGGGGSGATATNEGADDFAAAVVSVTSSATQVVAARTTRRKVTVRNEDATVSIRVGKSNVTSVANGILLEAKESIDVETVAAVHAISTGATVTVSYLETFDS